MSEAVISAYKDRLRDMAEKADSATPEDIVKDIRKNIKGLECNADDLERIINGTNNPKLRRAQELEQIIQDAKSNVVHLLGYEPQYNLMENPYMLLPRGTMDADYFMERTHNEIREVENQIQKIRGTKLDTEALLRHIMRVTEGTIDKQSVLAMSKEQKQTYASKFWYDKAQPVNEGKGRLIAFMMHKTPIDSKNFWKKLHPELDRIYESLKELRLLQARGLDA